MNRPSPPSLAVTLATLWLLSACGAEPGSLSVVPGVLADPDRHPVHLGLADASSPSGTLGWVTGARVTEGGGHIVVLDFVAPYVKVFGRDGHLRAAFVTRGDGPGESRGPAALAVSGDSLVLVADARRGLSVFDLDGKPRMHANVPGLMPLAAAQPCPGEWLVYGPRAGGGSPSREVNWLHRVRFTAPGSAEVTSLLRSPLSGPVPMGMHSLVSDGAGALVRHTLGGRPRLMRWECGSGSLRTVHEAEPLPQATVVAEGASRRRTSLAPGTRATAGVAVLPGGVVFGEQVYLGPRQGRTDLTLLAGGKERTISFRGSYLIQDSRPGAGVLVSTPDPVPQVFLVRTEDFAGMFSSP